ncbi:hypothetical protein AS850_03770 [Frondihabitans sp. 762G35]|uniref:hypothetical protein n=1 Tax=Frondihabitans sp. 762G35 TaxID=1446794 RepID=UPI000D21DBA7|nr:hypothetical protein [Frondihabitans sp. 762G35]ARC56193.1 hypothetical protein AS850_03770 [Frondihabitans sp. 762G35]
MAAPAPEHAGHAEQTGHSERGLDLELIIRAARLAVTTRTASKTLFVRHLAVESDVAERLLRKLEHCEVIAPEAQDAPGRPRRVLTTSGQLPDVVAEFERRHRTA